ncbi:MAG: hypothetical protein Q8L87_17530 [Anaerolineales bacterium]|nr:hypothetical protein [Anaerolineales bacterium]
MDIILNTLFMLSEGISGLVVAGLAVILMMLALVRGESGLMVFAAMLTIPSAYVLGSWSGVLLFVRLIPIFSLLSAFSISQEDPIFMWGFAIPPFLFLGYFIFNLVTFSFRGF